MSINAAKSILGGLLPFAANPVVLTVIGIGAASWAIANFFDDEDKETDGSEPQADRSKPQEQPLKRNERTVQATVHEPFVTVEETVKQASDENYDPLAHLETLPKDAPLQADAISHDEEAAKKELIRQAMSELGKRSAAARAKKKNDG